MNFVNQSGSCGVGLICNINGIKSREIVGWGIEAVKNLTHRGAVGADGKTGDGSGILTQIPFVFFRKELKDHGYKIPEENDLAIGVFFFYKPLEREIEKIIKEFGFGIIGWRDVPVNDDALGNSALKAKPVIRQLFLSVEKIEQGKKEILLFLARKKIEKIYNDDAYVSSLSTRTIIYKGMLVATNLDIFYRDLSDKDFVSAFCMFHQRFSTNTFPEWRLAQPFRTLAHNGEINTIQGNRNWMYSIEHEIRHDVFIGYEDLLMPLLYPGGSDSASLDSIVELLVHSGFSPEHAINMCIPPAWENSALDDDSKAFFEYQSLLMKPWDGPAAITFTDGNIIGAHMDRNGLRPLRYVITGDGILVLGSEMGLIELGEKEIHRKGRLGPGDTVSVNLREKKIKFTDEIIEELAVQRPYSDWMKSQRLRLVYYPLESGTDLSTTHVQREGADEITRKQIAFGYSSEEIQTSLKEMALKGKEMTFSMGDDTPLPSLSEKPQLLFRYFKQRFSQVTNPPIDPIRERMVMSLKMNLGHKRNFLIEISENARRLHLESPVLSAEHMKGIEGQNFLRKERIATTYSKTEYKNIGTGSLLLSAVRRLQRKVVDAVKKGAELVILSDADISRDRIAIPSLLAVSASFKALQIEGIANKASLIMETGEARDIHHIACLIGYGASAVHPYLALQTIGDMCDKGVLNIPYKDAVSNYKKAVEDGLLKIIARMGISTLNSYYIAQLFDSICLNADFIDEFFTETPVTIEADGINEIEKSVMQRHASGFETEAPALDFGGELRHRKGGEWHHWSPFSVIALNKFVKSGDMNLYREFSRLSDERPVFIRHLLEYKKGNPMSPEEVESGDFILKRFFSGAMSVGALSPEAHETIAEACNSLHIRSNSGEGGEDPVRYWTIKNSAIKQIASGRFGVTPAYLASAKELEIKIAQGAKPGEGGHLPEQKVTEYIAMLRHCNPNILLISPPPHHDIYSIEDLAQLINDLKEANPEAKVCVKLVSETGVGAVAAGVAKAYADIIQISGCEGGTGASPIGSIKNAGNYWEIGLAEAQKVLIENNLREKVLLRVDGGLRTGRDVVIAAMLGAEEFGFGTATMIAAGCVMARQCHLNTCPTGIATQDQRLRAKFRGTVGGIVSYFKAVAHEVREILAEMGFRSLDEIIGRADLLTVKTFSDYTGSQRIKLARILEGYTRLRVATTGGEKKCRCRRNDNPALSMNDKLVEDLLPYIEKAEPVSMEYEIRNINRSIPLKLNYHISLRYKDDGLPPDTIKLTFRGTAGQSFGAFNHRGITLKLIGDANDYVGKGMFGGRIIIRPEGIKDPHNHVIIGNTALYGATGGEFYGSGRAGERFAVRNSGAIAVIEGTGHHLCEYMTRGTVVALGETGYNVGAGMTGGIIYIFDEKNKFEQKLDSSYVKIVAFQDRQEIQGLRSLIENHRGYAESPRAEEILKDFENLLRYLKKVIPK